MISVFSFGEVRLEVRLWVERVSKTWIASSIFEFSVDLNWESVSSKASSTCPKDHMLVLLVLCGVLVGETR